MSKDDKHITFKLISSEHSNLESTIGGWSGIMLSDDKQERVIELDVVNFCGEILEVLKHSYLTNDSFINETENKALNYIEYK